MKPLNPINPRGPDGRYFRFDGCPLCNSDVVYDGKEYGRAHWICTGLIDPDDVNKPLDACPFQYIDGGRRE